MGKIVDYIHWRGDLSFTKDPLTDVDTLIFALLSYLPLKDVVPGMDSNRDISFKDAADQYISKFSTSGEKSTNITVTASSSFDNNVVKLFSKAAGYPRFEEIRLSKYHEDTDFAVGRQFAALTFTLPNSQYKKVISFRGTDKSIVGWKEDFDLTYMEQIPAQEAASEYLKRTVGLFSSRFILCGHSKGGNLAMFAGTHLNEARQRKLIKIINFDGPGFDFSIVQRDSFIQCEHKIINYVPEESMIGLLLDSIGKRIIVKSTAHSVVQHNAFNWEVEGAKLVQGSLSNSAQLLENSIKSWLTEISIPEREMFLDALFDLLGSSEGNVIKSDPQENLQDLKKILKKYSGLDKETRELLTRIFQSLTSEAGKTLSAAVVVRLPRIKRSESDQAESE